MQYQIIRSNRRTISMKITAAGELVVRCPLGMKEEAIRAYVESKDSWIQKHMPKEKPKQLTEAELQAMAQQARRVIPQRVRAYAPLVGVSYGRITIRSQRTRWGSCTAAGNLNFNCLLMRMPPEVMDYVVVHELCHRIHMNHSPAFWAEVERVLPNYKTSKKWLKDHGLALIGGLR